MGAGSNNRMGDGMARSRQEILSDLRSTIADLNCTIDEARAVKALEMVEKIRDEIKGLREVHHQEFAELKAAASEAIQLMRELSVAEFSGESQSAREKRNILIKHRLIKE